MEETKTILITGCSSGLGLAFLKHYVSQRHTHIHALDITPLPADALPSSARNITFHQTDITSEAALSTLASQLSSFPLTLIIHSAGIRGLVPSIVQSQRGDVAAAETYRAMDKATLMRTLEINTFGTFHVIKSFLPNLLLAAKASPPPKVVILSSRMGSLSANTAGGGYAYRASKAGLNAVVKSFSIDVPEVVFLLLHPGRVETGLVEWKEEGAMGVEDSLEGCLRVIEGVGREDSGKFVDRFGERIEW